MYEAEACRQRGDVYPSKPCCANRRLMKMACYACEKCQPSSCGWSCSMTAAVFVS